MNTYKVWIHVEEVNEDDDHYQNIDLWFGSTAEFDTEQEAIEFAVNLHDLGLDIID